MEAKRKRRRRPPRRVLKRLTADELMKESEFRRWRYHAPDSLKRQAYEIIRAQVRQSGPVAGAETKWTERVSKK